jgi:hypothetical protein
MKPNLPERSRIPQVLLGVFILWQLIFLLTANCFSLLPREESRAELPPRQPDDKLEQAPGTARRVVDFLAGITRRWADVTGQYQGWALYAPNVPVQATFVAVELRWDDERPGKADGSNVVLLSEIEPADPYSYFRPLGSFRVSAYEANLGLVMWTWARDLAKPEPEVWQRRLADAVRQKGKAMLAYLRWRLQSFQHEHPQWPAPTQVILLARIYPTPPPGRQPWHWDARIDQPVARWRPGAEVAPGYLPLESYNPLSGRFEPVHGDE